MVKKLITRAEFSRRAKVSAAAVTKACAGILKDAIIGKRIDVSHAASVKYIKAHSAKKSDDPPAPAAGIDPLYNQAVEACRLAGRFTPFFIRTSLKIGTPRATKIFKMMEVAGIIGTEKETEEKNQENQSEDVSRETLEKKSKHVRGHAAKREKKKQSGADDLSTIEVPDDIQSFADMPLRDLIDKFGTDIRFLDWLTATQKIEIINEKRLKNAQTKGELISRELVKHGVIGVFNAAHLRLMKDGAKSIAAGVVSKHASGADQSEIEAYVSDMLGSFIKPVKSKIIRAMKSG